MVLEYLVMLNEMSFSEFVKCMYIHVASRVVWWVGEVVQCGW